MGMLWDYIKEVAGASLDFARGGGEIIEILFWITVFCVPKIPNILSEREKKGIENEKSLRKIFIHKFLTKDGWRFAIVILGCFVFHFLVIAPYLVYKKIAPENETLRAQLNDKSPKLEGFVHRIMTADEPGTTNSFILADVSISNLGGTPSIAEEYGLAINVPTNRLVKAEEINFLDDFKLNFIHKNKPWMVDLKRRQLISEKTIKAMPIGESFRGWLAYRLRGIQRNQYQDTNIFFTFLDVDGERSYATNGIWHGKVLSETNYNDFTMVIPGAENIFYPIEDSIQTNWTPPELPPDCSDVIVGFGANGIVYSRLMAEISPENSGTVFPIKDLPDFLLSNAAHTPNFSWRTKNMWVRTSTTLSIGGRTVPYPVQPFVVSNRLYVEVQIPFSNEKRKIIMSDAFDPDLPIPDNWNRNYSTNYFSNGNITGGIYAYEVVNELTNPVLQVFYTAPNEVHVLGIFQVDENSVLVSFGGPPALYTFSNSVAQGVDSTQRITTVSLQSQNFREIIRIYTNDTTASLGEIYTNEFYRPIFPGQRAVFKYPSTMGNIGVFADWLNETDKSGTNIVEKP